MPDRVSRIANPTTARAALPRVWALAWPLILSNITVPLLGLVDTAVLGHLPDSSYIGAVALGATLFSFIFWGFGFLRMGTTGLTAQAFGRGDARGVALMLGRSVVLAAVIGIVIIVLRNVLVPVGLSLLDGSAQVTELATKYATIRIFAAPSVLANYAFIGWFLGIQRSRVTLLLMLVNNGANIVLDLWFVLGLGMTIAGVAWASMLSAWLTTAVGLTLAVSAGKSLGARLSWRSLLAWRDYAELLSVNGSLFVRTLSLLFAMAFFNAQSAQQGDLTLAANTVLFQFVLVASFALDGFAQATESLVGEAAGVRDRQRLIVYLQAATVCSLLSAGAISLVYLGAGPPLISLLTDLEAVREAANVYLPWLWAMPLAACGCYLLDGLFIGLTRTGAMRDTVILSTIGFYLPCWYFTQSFGNHGLWFAFLVFHVARGATLGTVLIWRPGWLARPA